MALALLDITLEHHNNNVDAKHHVFTKQTVSWMSYLPKWQSQTAADPVTVKPDYAVNMSATPRCKTIGFKNPWPSYHKPTRQEMWNSLEFGIDEDPCIQLAASHYPGETNSTASQSIRKRQAAHLLRVEKPDFSFDDKKYGTKSTWFGHASILLQMARLGPNGRPIRILFDPIFSMRSSPSQSFGPIRSYPPPCAIEDLPPIDLVLISHNHFDHFDYDTIISLWKLHSPYIRFLVPLGIKSWLLRWEIPANRIEELDWWDTACLSLNGFKDSKLRITCTPAQHNSGREGSDTNATLWSSWYIHHQPIDHKPCRTFFAGDTGYQFHSSPQWPPRPPKGLLLQSKETSSPSTTKRKGLHPFPKHEGEQDTGDCPPCPAFREIAERLGPPDILYLPIALGATWAYFKSFFSNYLPDSIDPFPRHSAGITGAIHMPPWDAVRVLKEMTEGPTIVPSSFTPVAIGIHWGTFVTDPTEVLKTLGQLQWACDQQNVQFSRSMPASVDSKVNKPSCFLALNHGDSVLV